MAKTSAKWEGDALVIEFKPENGFFKRKITLSSDGKTVMMMVTQSRDSGEAREETVVFEKQ
jgi:hypothetical protein